MGARKTEGKKELKKLDGESNWLKSSRPASPRLHPISLRSFLTASPPGRSVHHALPTMHALDGLMGKSSHGNSNQHRRYTPCRVMLNLRPSRCRGLYRSTPSSPFVPAT